MLPFYYYEPIDFTLLIMHIQMALIHLDLEQLLKYIDTYDENMTRDEEIIQVGLEKNQSNLFHFQIILKVMRKQK